MKYEVEIAGLSPLLQHRFDVEKLTSTKTRTGDRKMTDDDEKEAAKKFLYVSDGKVVQPALHIEGAMTKAATELKLAGSGKKTYKDLIKATCFVTPEYIPLNNQKWTVDARPVVNPTTRGRSMCYRPRFDEWSMNFEMEVLDDRADPAAIEEILRLAGLRVGIGSYRPRFGRFEIKKFAKVA